MMNDGKGGNGHSDARAVVVLTDALSPAYEPAGDASAVLAPVLALDGLEPWAVIQGPALDETAAADEEVLAFDDPAQLVLEPAESPDAPAAAETPRFELADPDEEAAGAVPAAGEPEAGGDVAEELLEADDPTFLDGPEAAARETEAPADAAEARVSPEAVGEEPAAQASAAEAAETVEAPVPPPPDPVEIMYGEARDAAEAGRTEDAKQMYRELLALHPAHVRARNNLALILDAEGNHQGALAELDRALDIDPENGTLLVNRGALLGAMGRYAAAERDLKKVLRVEPSHAEALFNLGVVMTKKGLWGEAVPHLKRAVELEPERAAAHYYLGEALNHVDDLAGALAAYQRATELQPCNPRALYGLGIIYDRLARPDDAAQMYRRSREVCRR